MLEVRDIAPGELQVVGTVDLTTVAVFRERLGEAVRRAVADGSPVLTVDLAGAELTDATGLGVLLGAHRRARRGGGRLRLVRLDERLSTLLLVSRLYRVLDVDHAGDSDHPGGNDHSAPAPEGPPAPVRAVPTARRPVLPARR